MKNGKHDNITKLMGYKAKEFKEESQGNKHLH